MNRACLAAALVIAASALAGCGNKGPLIRVPDAVEMPSPEEVPAAPSTMVPAESSTVVPASAATVDVPVQAQPEPTDDGTPGTPR